MGARAYDALVRPLLPAALLVLGLASAASAFDRYAANSGDTFLADTLRPGDLDEFWFDAARGTRVAITASGTAPGNWRPGMGVFGNNYANLGGQLLLAGIGTTRSVKLQSLRGLQRPCAAGRT